MPLDLSKVWQPCPRCGSKKVRAVSKGPKIIGFLFTSGLFFLLGQRLEFLKLFSLFAFIWAISVVFDQNKWKCNDCKLTWDRGAPKKWSYVHCYHCGYENIVLVEEKKAQCVKCNTIIKNEGKLIYTSKNHLHE